MIDKKNGHIRLTNSISLIPNLRFDSINAQKLGDVQEIREMGNEFKWLVIKNIAIDGNYFIISICFEMDVLKQVSISLQDHPFDLTESWESYNQKKEEEKVKQHQQWLTNELGKKRSYRWGEAWAEYDPKGGFSSIGIRYK